MNLVHYSRKPLGRIHSVKQSSEPDSKPRGFWVSVEGEDDWRHWCEAEDFGIPNLTCEHDIVLADDAELLRLCGAFEIDAFHDQYSRTLTGTSISYIDWSAPAKRWQGIIIAPYCWQRRLDGEASRWYHSWDCASGCIWDANAIASVNLRPRGSAEDEIGRAA